MDNQHRKIEGYRELTLEEISLMNRIKRKGAELLHLHHELTWKLDRRRDELTAAATDDPSNMPEFNRFMDAEPHRWAAIGKTDIQTGVMALVRAVAQPVETLTE